MASCSPYSEDLTCSVCLTIFTDPVTLLCGHSFCRTCITASLTRQNQCPQCRTAVPTDRTDFTTSHILKSLAEKYQETERLKKEYGQSKEESGWFCPEHEEKLKLFCVTDQQLACIICRDCERHEGHKFKPVKEAAEPLRKEIETLVQQVSDDNTAIEGLANKQKDEIRKTKEKSQQLMNHISSQFEEMHQFLRKREAEIKNELRVKEKEEVQIMSDGLKAAGTVLSEGKELEKNMKSVVEITDPETFLKTWTEDAEGKKARTGFRPRRTDLSVVTSSLSLMPYESHLQFFMWKEMLQVINRPDQLSCKSQDPGLSVSVCRHSSQLTMSKKKNFSKHLLFNDLHLCAFSLNEFTSGQHYWEMDVEKESFWELGIKDHFLTYEGNKFRIYDQDCVKELKSVIRPKKIGIYVNSESKEISFYFAENMTLIHTLTSRNNIHIPQDVSFWKDRVTPFNHMKRIFELYN